MLNIHVVNYEEGQNNGILTKFAKKLYEGLCGDKEISVSIGARPRKDVDINYHINYLPYKHENSPKTKNVLFITHIWEGYKLDALKKGMETADLGICMSKDTEDNLTKQGITKLTTVLPAHNGRRRRHQIVSILTNVYPDGCKRAEMFTELAKTLNNDEWAFRIMGSGWEDILVPLVANGLQVDYFPEFQEEAYNQILDSSDYSLYFGNDEGSMGLLDAKNAGLKLIATNQGFNKDIGIDYPFETQEELNEIFTKLNQNPVKNWTWGKYVEAHKQLWLNLI